MICMSSPVPQQTKIIFANENTVRHKKNLYYRVNIPCTSCEVA